MIGVIKQIKHGFGFISQVDAVGDLFFHEKNIYRLDGVGSKFSDLSEGDLVDFTLGYGNNGKLQALNVFHTQRVREKFNLIEEGISLDQRLEEGDLSEIDRFLNSDLKDLKIKSFSNIIKEFDIPIESYAQAKRHMYQLMSSQLRGGLVKLSEFHPDLFELMCAQFLENDGFEVERIGSYNKADGGVDILAFRKISGISVRLAVQIKHSERKISAAPIRELNGVLDRFKAHQGLIITSSTFTMPAIEETRSSFFRITLEDKSHVIRRLSLP